MSDAAWAPVEKIAVARQAANRITELIVDGTFQPGTRLPPERQLCALLGVSRSSVREAIRALAHMNVLEARHGQGTFVTSLSPEMLVEPLRFVLAVDAETLHELFMVRRIVEAAAAAEAAQHMPDEDVEELEELHRRLASALDEPEQFLELDKAMHDLIAAGAGNSLLMKLLSSFGALTMQSRARTSLLRAIRERAVADHEDLVDAIRARDPVRASAAMVVHLDHVERRYRQLAAEVDEEQ
jgi:GntR family transcriptional repressor for pyruvate dehydrogenase complex